MHSFKDSTGKAWELSINVGTVKRVKAMLKDEAGKPVDLSSLFKDDFSRFDALLGDICLLVDVLYVICKPEADKEKISDVQFGESLGGDSLEQAVEAFKEELIDFFHVSKARSSLRKLMSKGREMGLKVVAAAEAKMDEVDMDKAVEEMVKKIETGSVRSSTPTPAS